MKLRIMSDLHTEGYKFKYERLDEDVLVLAGDIGVGPATIDFLKSLPKDLPIVYVAGNHEYYKNNFQVMNELFAEEFEGTNIHWLNNSEWVFDGVRFLGGTMHSDFGLFGEAERFFVEDASRRGINDFYCIKTGEINRTWTVKDCKEEFAKFDEYMQFALKQPFGGKTVIVTHFCPSAQSVHPRFANSSITPFFTSNCEHLMGFSDLFIHGHTHDSYDYQINGTRVVCNPRGYGSENHGGWNPNLIVEI